jgi:Fe-S oxidoreductase
MKLSTTLEDVQYAASICLKCGCCTYGDWPENKHICPLFYRDECFTHGGGGFMSIVTALAEEKLAFDQKIADLAYTCAGCLGCDSRCTIIKAHPPQVDILDMIRLLRYEAVKRGFMPKGPLEDIQNKVQSGEDLGTPVNLELSAGVTDPSADTVVYSPCAHTSTEEEISTCLAQVLDATGRPVQVLDSGSCCGSTLYDYGFWDALAPLMESNWEKIRPLKEKQFVFTNPHCQEFMAKRYPENIADCDTIDHQHISQYLAVAFENGELKSNGSQTQKVSYHDPCYLGRGLGIYDAPRKVLGYLEGVELVEMERNRKDAFCCGARTMGNYFDEAATATAQERIKEFEATGADILVTACPYCKQNFQRVLPSEKQHVVKDLVEVVASAI